MPLPIQKMHDSNDRINETDKSAGNNSNFYLDYSLLMKGIPKTDKRMVTASDADADLLIRFWSSADKVGEDVYKVKNSKTSNDDILRLKAHGFLTGGSEEVKFTGKAKAVITTMVLGESNALQKQQKKKNYTEIMASMSIKGKSGYRVPKFAANSNLIRTPKDVKGE